ncbi:DUF5337 domain-containing protein [Pseudoponticoccus marisrubri]|uniref:DUF5337 domain-containing protein n=1 Tax=Pseudoponticoccus marisrubri TaxID=1685382 RepID=A0A0W7WEU2_9RHOB|nr:DUF5337 domain-containing protein [Pseudoponticoccus marisrubri]KUF09085.1 hypothetical protein AVJ23_19355 [Pseudoponticoccus marisrubri]
MADGQDLDRRGRVIALVIAGVGIGWFAMTALGGTLGWSQRIRALFDLAALAGFGWAIWMIYGLWRDRQKHKD